MENVKIVACVEKSRKAYETFAFVNNDVLQQERFMSSKTGETSAGESFPILKRMSRSSNSCRDYNQWTRYSNSTNRLKNLYSPPGRAAEDIRKNSSDTHE